jgi:NAD(P)-dependent dehydrogenase (short-subunit alcohol dehydrogenase family)
VGRLAGRVVVVTGDDTAGSARALAAEGAAVVLAGSDGAALGALAREITGAGGRVAVFVGDPEAPDGRAALCEMVDELFPGLRDTDTPEPA